MHYHKSYRFLLFLISFLLTSCAVGPNFHTPKGPCTERYTECPLPEKTASANTPGGESQFYTCEDIPAAWWTLFRSPSLNRLICRGIANSPNLAAAKAALRQAEANQSAQIGSLLFPSVDGQFGALRQEFSLDSIGLFGTRLFNLFNATVNVGYTPDIFGGNRRQVEAFGALADFQRFELEAAYLTLTANITTTAIAEASLEAQVHATRELVRVEENLLKIVKSQFELGAVSGTDVLTQQTELAQTRALLPALEKGLAQTRDALSVLVGNIPSQSCLPTFNLSSLHLPKKLPISLPSKLICQRPDVRAAEALLHQASAQIGVATANLLPSFPLTASFGNQALKISNLFIGRNQTWLLGSQTVQPIFHGVALIEERKAAIAAYDQAFAQYKQIVLQGFQNVADSLNAIETDARTLQAQTLAENSARELLALSEDQFRLGAIDYLTLLNAKRQYQQAHINRIQAQAARFADTAALFQALGGGWWNRKCDLIMH